MASVRLIASVLGLALLLAGTEPVSAARDSARDTQSLGRGVVATGSVGTFNWLPPATVTRASYAPGARAIPRQIGRGSWICSPAGSGRGSRCYAN